MAGQKSKKANRINIQNAVYCKLLTDESGSTTYDEPKSLSPAMQVQLTATLASGILHGDGVQQENIAKITGISMVLDVNKIPIEDRAIILGNKYENGILEEVGAMRHLTSQWVTRFRKQTDTRNLSAVKRQSTAI